MNGDSKHRSVINFIIIFNIPTKNVLPLLSAPGQAIPIAPKPSGIRKIPTKYYSVQNDVPYTAASITVKGWFIHAEKKRLRGS